MVIDTRLPVLGINRLVIGEVHLQLPEIIVQRSRAVALENEQRQRLVLLRR